MMKDFITEELLNELGFELTSYKQNEFKDGDHFYGKAQCKRTRMTVLTWNTQGTSCTYLGDLLPENIYLGIGKDGGTRTAFNGYVFNEEDFRKVINLTW